MMFFGRGRPGRYLGFSVLTGSALFMLFVLATAAGQADSSGRSDAGSCLVCHGQNAPLPAEDILHSRHAVLFGEGGQACAACHGPSRDHFSLNQDGTRPLPDRPFGNADDRVLANKACMDCHAAQVGPHWAGSAHEFEELACTDCHAVHDAEGDPALDPARQDETCFGCHQRERAEFLRPNRHPVGSGAFSSDAGLLTCSDCHDAHGSTTVASLNRMTLNETCYDCHAELRGPFLWEHAPVREDCSSCHLPHGSIHEDLLRQRPPQLCQQCHLAQFHPSTVRSGRGLPPSGADPNLLGQSCMNCHTAVHGSNHPSSPGFTR
jgi:DmsE family decaheme c-type cytochrome